jgi:hypothetical protein
MPKRAPKHPGTPGHGRPQAPKPAKPQRERVNFYVDPDTMRILDNLVESMPDLDNRSAGLRFLARWYERTAQGSDAAS